MICWTNQEQTKDCPKVFSEHADKLPIVLSVCVLIRQLCVRKLTASHVFTRSPVPRISCDILSSTFLAAAGLCARIVGKERSCEKHAKVPFTGGGNHDADSQRSCSLHLHASSIIEGSCQTGSQIYLVPK